MKRCCGNCKMGEAAKDGETDFVYCRALPPRPVAIDIIHWVVPTMKPTGFCHLHKLSIWKLIKSDGA